MSFPANRVTAIIGPSGCGKSTLLRCFNRIHDLYPDTRYEARLLYIKRDQFDWIGNGSARDANAHGYGFQKPNAFLNQFSRTSRSVFNGRVSGKPLEEQVERSLRSAALWDEVKDRLRQPAYNLSGGQQQRLHSPRTCYASGNVAV